MLVLAFMAYPPVVHAEMVWTNPVSLHPLPQSPATGRVVPNLTNDVIDGTLGLATSTTPILTWNSVPAGVSQVTFEIVSLAAKNPTLVWQHTVSVDSTRTAKSTVAAGKLIQGHTYKWVAKSTTPAATHGPFGLSVDVQRSGTQQIVPAAGIGISVVTGELVYDWTGPSIGALGGPLGWNLLYRPTNRLTPGLPKGWNLVATGSVSWETLTSNPDGSMTLTDNVGWSVTFTKTGDNLWQPHFGNHSAGWRQGSPSTLNENADGSFQVTDNNRTVTVFGAVTPTAPQSHPSKVWVDGAPTANQTWTQNRLAALTDPVAGGSINFFYGGDPICDAPAENGFIATPSGDLCSVQNSAGNVVMLEYVDTPAGPQIGRLVAAMGMGRLAQVTDLGWDASGRFASLRQPRVDSALASGVLHGISDTNMIDTTQVEYDQQGRVNKVTEPAPLRAGENTTPETLTRPFTTYTYAPFTAKSMGTTETISSDPLTMRTDWTRDTAGRVERNTYNTQGQLVHQVDESSGTQSETTYNAQGQPVANLGPTKGSLTSPSTPLSTVAYDQDTNGKAWTGLGTRYWDNAGFNGAPNDATTGPILPGSTSIVPTLNFNWNKNPVGTGDWSARLSGLYVAPTSGKYAFRSTTTAQLWVNGVACIPSCAPTLAQDATATIQVDVSSPGGAAGVNILATPPGGAEAPIPTAQLRPNYGLATSAETREHVNGGTGMLTTKNEFDPVTGQLIATDTPMHERTSRTYAPYDPATNNFAQSTSVTDASGHTTTFDHNTTGATATDCQGNTVTQPAQSLSQTNTPGLGPVGGTYGEGGGLVKTTTPTSTICGSHTLDNLTFTTSQTGLGDTYSVSNTVIVGGNPLEVSTTTHTKTGDSTETSFLDINGNVYETIDAHGTTTVQHFDPATQLLTSVTDTTRLGEVRTTAYTYTTEGLTKTISLNGRLIVTNTYQTDGLPQKRDFQNGSSETYGYDANNNQNRVVRTFQDGTTVSEHETFSPTNRILSRSLTGPTGTANYHYTYNQDGRLIDTVETGTEPVLATRWQSDYAGTQAANGNRTSSTTSNAAGETRHSTFTYGEDNNTTSSTHPNLANGIESDAAGRITRFGTATLTYDAASNLTSAHQGTKTFTFTGTEAIATHASTSHPTHSIISRPSGQNLLLDPHNKITGQLVDIADDVTVSLDATGAPQTWHYNDQIGNDTWRAIGTNSPTSTHLYSPSGNTISNTPLVDPTTPLALAELMMGWQAGSGVETLPFATKIMISGAREYSPDTGRFLQSDSNITASSNAYEYAAGDPINLSDPTGHWTVGQIVGTVVAVVVGIAIGTLTFGVGTAGAATYGLAQFAATVAVGAVAGAVSGALGNTVQQLVDGGEFNWQSLGIETFVGLGLGAAGAGIGAFAAKRVVPMLRIRKFNKAVAKAGQPEMRRSGIGESHARFLQDALDENKAARSAYGFFGGRRKVVSLARAEKSGESVASVVSVRANHNTDDILNILSGADDNYVMQGGFSKSVSNESIEFIQAEVKQVIKTNTNLIPDELDAKAKSIIALIKKQRGSD